MRSKMCKFVELHITPMLWQVLMLALLVCALHVDVKDLLPTLDIPVHTEVAIEESDGFTDVVYADLGKITVEKTAFTRRIGLRSSLRSNQCLEIFIFTVFLLLAFFCGRPFLFVRRMIHNSHTFMMAYIHDLDGMKSY